MLGIGDVRDYIAGLGIAKNEDVYCSKLEGEKDKTIGIYHLKRAGPARIAIGGIENTSYRIKPVSILIHWNRSPRDTEKVSDGLFNMLRDMKNVTVNGTMIKFTQMQCLEPIDVGTDDNGIYEMVIELDFYYERQE